ncbi:unnamed protein product, partial [Rotaria sp. Silwood2]
MLPKNKLKSLIPNVLNVDKNQINQQQYTNVYDIKNTLTSSIVEKSLLVVESNKHTVSFTDSKFTHQNKTLETTIQCVGSLYNQSCLYHNLYYVDSAFTILTIKGQHLPSYSVRIDAFVLWPLTPNKRVFDSYSDLETFVRTVIDPKIIPSVTLYFGQYWHDNIGHALFDGLYPAYVALIRFS